MRLVVRRNDASARTEQRQIVPRGNDALGGGIDTLTGRGGDDTLVGGNGMTTIGCLGAAQVDVHGNINSTSLVAEGGPFLVGSGGGNDVITRPVAAKARASQGASKACSTITRNRARPRMGVQL